MATIAAQKYIQDAYPLYFNRLSSLNPMTVLTANPNELAECAEKKLKLLLACSNTLSPFSSIYASFRGRTLHTRSLIILEN